MNVTDLIPATTYMFGFCINDINDPLAPSSCHYYSSPQTPTEPGIQIIFKIYGIQY